MSEQDHGARPSLTVLRAFEATVRLGSVTGAARELHFTHSAVSRHVRALEFALGRELFERRNRGIHPTPAARRLAAGVADGLALLDRHLERARVSEDHDAIVLSCEPTLLMRWLIPRLPRLATLAPGMSCRLVAAGGPVAFARDGIDIALRREDFWIAPDLHKAVLMDEHIGPVCRPDVGSGLREPADLGGHTLLHTQTRPDAWQSWARATGNEVIGVRDEQFEHFYLMLQAASAGLGVALASRAMVVDDLAAGQLIAPLGFVADGSRYQLLSPIAFGESPKHAAVLQWLKVAASDDGLSLPG
jgi:DNA-binding transcriptional LysR family regulator